jgi:hypothetical protein
MINAIKDFIVNTLFGKLTRYLRYRQKVKEARKRDPFIY